MIKGRHKKEWFLNNVNNLIININTGKTILITNSFFANQLFLNQNLNNQKYTLLKN
jgi:hypothetical protein